MRQLFVILLISTCFVACKPKTLTLNDVSFLTGSWSSAGTDVFEKWERHGAVMEGSSYRLIRNVVEKVDSMTVHEKGGQLVMTVHIRYSKKNTVAYLSEITQSGFIFKNDSSYPKQISYARQSTSQNLIVMAGDDLAVKDKHFEFLFVPVDSL